jgi:hypothetical protein
MLTEKRAEQLARSISGERRFAIVLALPPGFVWSDRSWVERLALFDDDDITLPMSDKEREALLAARDEVCDFAASPASRCEAPRPMRNARAARSYSVPSPIILPAAMSVSEPPLRRLGSVCSSSADSSQPAFTLGGGSLHASPASMRSATPSVSSSTASSVLTSSASPPPLAHRGRQPFRRDSLSSFDSSVTPPEAGMMACHRHGPSFSPPSLRQLLRRKRRSKSEPPPETLPDGSRPSYSPNSLGSPPTLCETNAYNEPLSRPPCTPPSTHVDIVAPTQEAMAALGSPLGPYSGSPSPTGQRSRSSPWSRSGVRGRPIECGSVRTRFMRRCSPIERESCSRA